MSSKNLSILDELSSPFDLLTKGSQFLAQWMDMRNKQRYEEFVRAALDGGVFPENAEAMTPEDFLAMLRALELDIEGEKATVYGRLAFSLATGKVGGHLKRHFIKSLSEFSYGQVNLLRHAWISERFEVFPGTGGGNRQPKEFLGIDSKSSINRLTFERWGMLEDVGLSHVGRQFVEACFTPEELEPSAVGFRLWSKGMIQLVCNEMGTPTCDAFLLRLSEDAHREAIHTLKAGVRPGHSNRPFVGGPVMVVLLVADPQRLADRWDLVEEVLRGRALTVVASTDPNAELPAIYDNFERIDASPDHVSKAVQMVLARFEAHGLRGHTDA